MKRYRTNPAYLITLCVMLLGCGTFWTFSDETTNLEIDIMEFNQSQFNITHNDLVYKSDVLMMAAVRAYPANASPDLVTDTTGTLYIVPDSADGDWSGKDGQLTYMQNSAWKFIEPVTGMFVNAPPHATTGDMKVLSYDSLAWTLYDLHKSTAEVISATSYELSGYLTVGATATVAQQAKIGSGTPDFNLNTQLVIGDVNGIVAAIMQTQANSDAGFTFATDYDGDNRSGGIKFDYSEDEFLLYNNPTAQRDLAINNDGDIDLANGGLNVALGIKAATANLVPSATPSTASAGDMFYNSTSNKFYGHNGTAWVALDE